MEIDNDLKLKQKELKKSFIGLLLIVIAGIALFMLAGWIDFYYKLLTY